MKPQYTFYNLSAEKQERIISEALREFASHGYRKASMNNLVKKIGIAKGSLYQYFRNKEALFLYLFDRFTDLVKEKLSETDSSGTGNDFFTQLENTFKAGILFIDQYPEYYQIYLRLQVEQETPQRNALLDKVRIFSEKYFSTLCRQAQNQGLIRSDISCPMVVFLVLSVMDRFLQEYAIQRYSGDTLSPNFPGPEPGLHIKNTIDILKNGLCL